MDCRTCGACCTPGVRTSGYVTLTKRDEARLPVAARGRLVRFGVWAGGRTLLATEIDTRGRCVCVGLRGLIGEVVGCGFYTLRPDACRKFKKGSSMCLAAREALRID